MKLYCERVDWLELKTLILRRFFAAVRQSDISVMCASRLRVTFYSGYMKAKSNNRNTNLNKTAPKVFERSTNVALNLMFVVYVVASCVRLIRHHSSGWSVISTSSLSFLSPRFFCCWHCCREKRPPSSFWDSAAEGEKKKSCGAPERGSVQRESHKTHKNGRKTLTYWSTSDS